MYVSHGWITLRPCRPGTRLRGCDGGQSSYKRVKGRTESVGWRSEDAGLVGGQGRSEMYHGRKVATAWGKLKK